MTLSKTLGSRVRVLISGASVPAAQFVPALAVVGAWITDLDYRILHECEGNNARV